MIIESIAGLGWNAYAELPLEDNLIIFDEREIAIKYWLESLQ